MENNRNLTHSRKDELSDWTADDYVGVILKRFWLFILNFKKNIYFDFKMHESNFNL